MKKINTVKRAALTFATLVFTVIAAIAQPAESGVDTTKDNLQVNEINKPSSEPIIAFDATFADGKTSLSWQSGYNNTASQYDIEFLLGDMANTQVDYKKVGTLKPSTEVASGKFTFDHLVNEVAQQSFYRLKVYNTNGTVSYSKTLKINTANKTAVQVNGTVVMNGILNVTVNQPFEVVEVLNTNGTRVFTKNLSQQTGNVQLFVGNLSKGMYFVHFMNNNQSLTNKILVQ